MHQNMLRETVSCYLSHFSCFPSCNLWKSALRIYQQLVSVFTLVLVSSIAVAAAVEPCRIVIVDESNSWPVPLVTLETTNHVKFVSDNAGVIAFDLPELMNTQTWFTVQAHGYLVAPDRFGFQGVRLTPKQGETLTIKVRRQQAAKRMGRLTGLGLFAESQKCGDDLNWKEQGIAGCDSVQNVVHNGMLHWGWGDTSVAKYPLGRFHMTGATTALRPLDSFEPPVRLRYDYVVDGRGASRDVARIAGDGPTWLSGYVSLIDVTGKQRLGATYSKIQPPLTEYEQGLCVWDDQAQAFQHFKTLWEQTEATPESPMAPSGHPVLWKDESDKQWVLFGDPFPTLKCPATFEAWSSPESWIKLDAQQTVTVKASTESVKPHRGAIVWSEYRNKWVTVFAQEGGVSSYLGEIWYAESSSPIGPWSNAIQIVTHNQYSFYNPKLHIDWVPDSSPILFFEGTYTHAFSKTKTPTPRYDYNQVLYRLDLDEWPWSESKK